MRYHDKIALIAKRQDEADEAERNLAKQRRLQRRIELQDQYAAVGEWHLEQIKLHGLDSTVLAAVQAKLNALDAIVDAA